MFIIVNHYSDEAQQVFDAIEIKKRSFLGQKDAEEWAKELFSEDQDFDVDRSKGYCPMTDADVGLSNMDVVFSIGEGYSDNAEVYHNVYAVVRLDNPQGE